MSAFTETLDFLYQSLPMYQRVGRVAYKKDLTNTLHLCKAIGNPQDSFKSIHIAGTNGKGSVSHMTAAILQESGYEVGLYTSPHLKRFTERIKVNGLEVEESFIVGFVAENKPLINEIKPSFFELTVVMAFQYFASKNVDVAVIETGLGGRLDSTNIIKPILSVITNISFDHMDMLGDSLEQIAMEKAGIIKEKVPVIIGERQPGLDRLFERACTERLSEITFASDSFQVDLKENKYLVQGDKLDLSFTIDELAYFQTKNLPTVLAAIESLNSMGISITNEHIESGLRNTSRLTGFKGRWQKIKEQPRVVCDAAHNIDGIKMVIRQLSLLEYNQLRCVLGFSREKNAESILKLFPSDTIIYFCKAKIPRAQDTHVLLETAKTLGIKSHAFNDVNRALEAAIDDSESDDFIFVGGSIFILAELNDI